MIGMTQAAATALRDMLERKNAPEGSGLRLMVQKGGCAGMQYAMKIDQPNEGDAVFRHHAAALLVDPASLEYLDESEVDYSFSLTDGGFKILNPGAARSCGCGSSFEPAKAAAAPPPSDPAASAMPCAGGSDS